MKDKKRSEKNNKQQQAGSTKSLIAQWVVPSLVFFGAVALMIYNYGINQSKSIEKKHSVSIYSTAERYSSQLYAQFKEASLSSLTIADLLSEESDKKSKSAVKLLGVLANQSGIQAAAVVDKNGKGIDNMGEAVNVKLSIDDSVFQGNKFTYLYDHDASVYDQNLFWIIVPLDNDNGYVISYINPDYINRNVKISEYDGRTFGTIIDSEGNILFSTSSQLDGKTNLIDYMQKNISDNEYKGITRRIGYNENSQVVLNIGGTEFFNSFVPFGQPSEKWFFVLSMGNSYVSKVKNSDFAATNKLIINLIIAMIVFAVLVAVINVIGKLRFNSKSKVLQQKADTDLLTELNNKISTERKIKEYIEDNPEMQALMFIFDIDNFKKINDTRGHAFGDEVLREIGMRLKAEFRVSDIIGRVGGDEFVLFLKNIKDDSILKKEADRVVSLFKDFQVGQYSKYKVTASIGCAVFPRDANTFETLYKAADGGMYKAKKRGKHQLAFYNEDDMIMVSKGGASKNNSAAGSTDNVDSK